jgi:hypothetical protein
MCNLIRQVLNIHNKNIILLSKSLIVKFKKLQFKKIDYCNFSNLLYKLLKENMRYYVCKLCCRYRPKKYATGLNELYISNCCKYCRPEIDNLQTGSGSKYVYEKGVLGLSKYYS